ncbi:MAG: helix-turn-helix domain-containing protein [Isosphaeraceae bacterium]
MSTNYEDQGEGSEDWVSQAEAARIQSVSRQAIHKLVQGGRLRTKTLGGHVLVSRADLERFRPQPAGRPRTGETRRVDRIKRLVDGCTPEERRILFDHLRPGLTLHALESRLGLPAEAILEAIDRAGPLTIRMIRGVIAEAVFRTYVVDRLAGWESLPCEGDHPYDFLLKKGDRKPIRVQVKLQRSRDGRPWESQDVPKRYRLAAGYFVAETHRTRGGKNRKTGEETRPYKYGQFDILAVAMQPSTSRWQDFRYSVANWLIPQLDDGSLIEEYQPIPLTPNGDWTDDFETCAGWLWENRQKTIQGRDSPD